MESWARFLRSLSTGSKDSYIKNADRFLDWAKLTSDEAIALSDLELEKKIEDYIYFLTETHVEKQDKSPNSVHTMYYAVRKLGVVNRKNCNWVYLQTCLPRQKAPSGRKAYTDDHIRRMADRAKTLRDKAWILFIACTDIRPGSASEMNAENLVFVEDGAVITVYNEDIEEYRVGVTPEATKAIQDYFEKRNLMGYPVTKQSPLWTKDNYHDRASIDSLKDIARKLAELAGIRAPRGQNASRGRDSIQANNGFRKRFSMALVEANIHEKDIEYFMGHYGHLQDKHYYRDFSNEKVWAKYYPAIQRLTLDKTEKLRLENEHLEKTNQEIESVKTNLSNMEQLVAELIVERDYGKTLLQYTMDKVKDGTVKPKDLSYSKYYRKTANSLSE